MLVEELLHPLGIADRRGDVGVGNALPPQRACSQVALPGQAVPRMEFWRISRCIEVFKLTCVRISGHRRTTFSAILSIDRDAEDIVAVPDVASRLLDPMVGIGFTPEETSHGG
jgi:hypothetical protein